MRSESEWQNHPVDALLLRQKIGESHRRHRRRGDSIIFFQPSAVFGDRRRAAVSATDAEDYGVAPPLQLGPEIRLVRKHVSRLPHNFGLHRRHPSGKPPTHLFKKFIGPAKAHIHQIDCFAIERAKTGSQWLRPCRVSWPSDRVQNCIVRFALSHESSCGKSVRSPAFRPQASDADPFRDATRLRPEGGTTNCEQAVRYGGRQPESRSRGLLIEPRSLTLPVLYRRSKDELQPELNLTGRIGRGENSPYVRIPIRLRGGRPSVRIRLQGGGRSSVQRK